MVGWTHDLLGRCIHNYICNAVMGTGRKEVARGFDKNSREGRQLSRSSNFLTTKIKLIRLHNLLFLFCFILFFPFLVLFFFFLGC